jgi:hypothetical protein
MSLALDAYEEYARQIFSLLSERATVDRHTLAVYTVSRTIGITRSQIVFRSGHVQTRPKTRDILEVSESQGASHG